LETISIQKELDCVIGDHKYWVRNFRTVVLDSKVPPELIDPDLYKDAHRWNLGKWLEQGPKAISSPLVLNVLNTLNTLCHDVAGFLAEEVKQGKIGREIADSIYKLENLSEQIVLVLQYEKNKFLQ
jgi:hypothetical protein